MFSRDAVMAIHDASKGIPRTISVICGNALLTGFALGRRPVDSAIIEEVCREFDLAAAKPTMPPQAAGTPAAARAR
jgi:hypothetical protein